MTITKKTQLPSRIKQNNEISMESIWDKIYHIQVRNTTPSKQSYLISTYIVPIMTCVYETWALKRDIITKINGGESN